MNHYIKNNETGKIELHFNKADYMALTEEQKREIKGAFLWSRFAGGWVSRAKHPNTYHAVEIAKRLKLEFKGEEGDTLSFEEQKEREMQRAGERAERMEGRAAKAEETSNQYYERSNKDSGFLSLGEPIKVGHHSERRHRKIIEQANNNMRKSVEASKKAEYYEDRAETAKRTAEGAQYKNPKFLGNRIRERETKLRELHRLLSGIGYVNRTTGERYDKKNPCQISDKQREHLEARIAEETEKLNFYKEKLAGCGIVIEDKKSLAEKRVTHVKYGGVWYPVKSFNATSVTILNWLSISHFGWKAKYTAIQGIKTQEEMYLVLDRDGKEVKPQIKFKD